MVTKLVIRLLDQAGALLAWAPVMALAKGDACLWATEPFVSVGEADGEAATLVIHWADLNVQRRVPFQTTVRAGQPLVVNFDGPVLRVASDEGPLPAVTVRAPVTTITIPTCALGVIGQ